MKKLTNRILAGFIVSLSMLAVLAFAPKPAGKIRLKLNLKPSIKYLYTINIDQKIGVGGQVMDQSINTDYLIHVTEVNKAGNATLEYTTLRYAMQGPAGNIDTDKPDTSNAMSRMYSAMVGHVFKIIVSPEGEILEVEGYAAMIDKMVDAIKTMVPADKLEQVRTAMRAAMTDESFKGTMEQSLNIFPDKEIALGDNWKKTIKNPMNLSMNVQTNYTLDKIEAKTVTLKVDSKVTPSEDESPNPMMSGLEMTGTQTGTLLVDRETGIPLDFYLDQDFVGTSEKLPDGMTIKSKMRIKTSKRK